jgi:two-component system, OmpR family, sensor kinase
VTAPPSRTVDAPARRFVRVRQRVRRAFSSIRLRLVWWFILVLALTTLASIVVVRQVLVQQVDARIDADLAQEVDEVTRLAAGNDPATGEPFGDRVDRVFEVFLDRNVPSPNEMLLTFVAGRPYRHAPMAEEAPLGELHVPYPLEQDPRLTALWATREQPLRGHAATPGGRVEFVAVPFLAAREPRGVFVVAIFRDQVQADADAATLGAGLAGTVMLIVGSLLAIRLADGILSPVRDVTRLARSISETDIRRRLPERGFDEVSELSTTFNGMLDRLAAAFDTQRRFVQDAGHELRTPITIIRGHLDVMSEDPDDRRRTLEVVRKELERMSRIVSDLLTLARTEQPDFVNPRIVDVDELTVRMLETARGLAERDWRLDGITIGRALIDEQRMMQAVLQLAQNAVAQTSDGQTIAIGSKVDSDEAHFWVRDTGRGVSDADRERIFERFYRGGSLRSESDGAGLGLSIVSAIAAAHGGRVEVESNVGEGALFRIVVPAGEQAT